MLHLFTYHTIDLLLNLPLLQVFSQMLHVGVQLEFEAVHEVLSATVMELKRNKDKILCPGPKDDVDNIKVRKP